MSINTTSTQEQSAQYRCRLFHNSIIDNTKQEASAISRHLYFYADELAYHNMFSIIFHRLICEHTNCKSFIYGESTNELNDNFRRVCDPEYKNSFMHHRKIARYIIYLQEHSICSI
jgi:hypothetical protein